MTNIHRVFGLLLKSNDGLFVKQIASRLKLEEKRTSSLVSTYFGEKGKYVNLIEKVHGADSNNHRPLKYKLKPEYKKYSIDELYNMGTKLVKRKTTKGEKTALVKMDVKKQEEVLKPFWRDRPIDQSDDLTIEVSPGVSIIRVEGVIGRVTVRVVN